jgi:hypothetical protein
MGDIKGMFVGCQKAGGKEFWDLQSWFLQILYSCFSAPSSARPHKATSHPGGPTAPQKQNTRMAQAENTMSHGLETRGTS